jgi:hypothetical protein
LVNAVDRIQPWRATFAQVTDEAAVSVRRQNAELGRRHLHFDKKGLNPEKESPHDYNPTHCGTLTQRL